MKIITNIHIQKVAGITHYLLSLANYIKRTYKENEIELVGINVARGDRPSETVRGVAGAEKNWKLYSISIPQKKITNAAATAKDLKEFEFLMEPVIHEHEKVIATEKPDVVLLSGAYHLVWCLYIAAMRSGIKKIALHCHGLLYKEVETYQERIRDIYRQMEESYAKGTAFYIFPSRLALEAAEKDIFRRSAGKHIILPNPIEPYFFDDRRLVKDQVCDMGFPVASGHGIINTGYVGRWTREKNPQFMLRLARMNSRISGKLDIFAIAGLNPKKAAYRRINKKIKLIPPVSNRMLKHFYQAMNVIVCPSNFETYGNIAQESIAAGTPALISRNMGVAETFRKFGLDFLITDFTDTRKVIDKIGSVESYKIPNDLRDELKKDLSPDTIYGRLIGALRLL